MPKLIYMSTYSTLIGDVLSAHPKIRGHLFYIGQITAMLLETENRSHADGPGRHGQDTRVETVQIFNYHNA